MAKQINFYSVSALPTEVDAGGIYFSAPTTGTASKTTGEIYKGSQRFGAPRVTLWSSGTGGITDCSDITDVIRGDVFISEKDTYIYDGSAWGIVKVNHNANLSAYVSGLVAGNSTSSPSTFIQYIKQGSDGKVTAHAAQFPTLNLGSTTKSGSSNGVTVSVTTQSGAVTGVTVAAPTYSATAVTKSSNDCGVYVSVTTENGSVKSVSVSADDINCSTVTATTGTFTNLNVTNTATFTATTVSATSLTVNGSTVEQIADSRIGAIAESTVTSTSNGVTVSVTTQSGKVTNVEVGATEIANVMHFKGTSTTLPTYGESTTQKAGDIWIVGANPTGYITSSGWGSTTAAEGNKKLVAGQEYILTSQNGFELIGDQTAWGLSKAQTGSSTSNLKGLKAAIELKANAAPTVALTNDSLVTTSANIANNAANDKLITASAVAAYAIKKGDVTGGSSESTSNGVKVVVSTAATTAKPSVTVTVTSATLFGGLDSTVSSSSGPVEVTVTQTDGKLTACAVTWTNSSNGVSGGSSKSAAWTDGPYVSVDIAANTAAPSMYISGFGSAAAKGVVTNSASFKTANYSLSLPTAQAVAAYVDAAAGAGVTGGNSTSGPTNGITTKVTIASKTAAPTMELTVAPATTITSTGTSITTAAVVYSYIWNEALVWKSADGTIID